MYTYNIYLFKPKGLLGRIITLVTGSAYSHSAILVDGILYDSSESRGDFNVSDIDVFNTKRDYVRFTVKSENPLDMWVEANMWREYDWKGIIGWLFKKHNKDEFYCFEATYDAMIEMGVTHPPIPRQLHADDLIKILKRSNLTSEIYYT